MPLPTKLTAQRAFQDTNVFSHEHYLLLSISHLNVYCCIVNYFIKGLYKKKILVNDVGGGLIESKLGVLYKYANENYAQS